MIGLVIVTHGRLAAEYVSVMEHIVGSNLGVIPVSISPTDKLLSKEREIIRAINIADKGFGVLVVTDMHGSTPANIALKASRGRVGQVLFGVNLPMLIKLAKVRHIPIEKAAEMAVKAGRKYIDFITIRD